MDLKQDRFPLSTVQYEYLRRDLIKGSLNDIKESCNLISGMHYKYIHYV
jgi:hypothetical protein